MVDIDKIVEELHNRQLIRKHRINGDWYTIYCPFHKNGEERKPSCGILRHDQVRDGKVTKAGLFHCFTCGAIYSLTEGLTEILRLKSKSISGQEWLQEYIPDFDSSDFDYLLSPQDTGEYVLSLSAVSTLKALVDTKTQPYIGEDELSKYRYTVPYMYERKLTDEVINTYDVGVDLNWVPEGRKHPVPCITFPVRDRDGNTLFICRRSIKGKLFNYPKGVDKPVYGIDKIPSDCKSLIICESCFNALTCVVYGYSAVALLGTGTPKQISQIKELGITELVLCMDGDDAGKRATDRLYKAFKSTHIVWRIEMPPGKDVNDCSMDEFENLYKNRI